MKKKGEIRKGSQLSLFSMKYMMTSSQDGDPKKEPKSFPT